MGGREPDEAGAVVARRVRWQTREEMAGYRRARWQFLWVIGQEGRWQGARWGRGSGGKEGQMARKGGMAGCSRARWQFLWVVGQWGVWQGARWGRGSRGKEGQVAGEGGDGRVQEGQVAVAGGGRAGGGWWAGGLDSRGGGAGGRWQGAR